MNKLISINLVKVVIRHPIDDVTLFKFTIGCNNYYLLIDKLNLLSCLRLYARSYDLNCMTTCVVPGKDL